MKKLSFRRLSPSRILVSSFIIIISIGTFFLSLPVAVMPAERISVLTALFTATSAVSVTGLSVVDVSKTFSSFGKAVILVLIQLGGLGIMTFSSILMMAIGKKITYHERKILKEDVNWENTGDVLKFIRKLIRIVVSIELVGVVFLTIGFLKEMPLKRAFYFGVFHSVSAFCNAGFSLFSDSLVGFKGNYLINLTISLLIIFGGIGFAVINSSLSFFKTKVVRFNLTSKLAIIISVFLTIFGMIAFFLMEHGNVETIGALKFHEKVLASFFQSVTTRTAGFNTVAVEKLEPATVFIFLLLMFIGASPGSTGGGIKTTTFGVIIFYVVAIIRGNKDVEVTNRRITWEILNRAVAILVISFAYISLIILLILMTSNLDFEKVIFEVVSAFGTVGLSMGITSSLNTFSRILIIVTMLIGRVGPLTFALAFGEKLKIKSYRYPKENILVG